MKLWQNNVLILLSLGTLTAAPMDFRKLEIVCNSNNSRYAQTGSVIANSRDEITLALVLSARVEKLYSEIYISPVNGLIMANDTIPPDRLRNWDYFKTGNPVIRWYLILPANLDTVYRNTPKMRSQWAQVIYREIPIPEWNNQWSVSIANLKEFQQLFPGTVRFKAEIADQGQFVATPGLESRSRIATGDYGGLSSQVFRLSLKGQTGNRFLDNLLMFQNLPYIANSNSWNGYWREHQTRQWIGGDLMTFTYFAAELSGRSLLSYFGKLPMPPANTFDITDYYGREAHCEDGFYKLDNAEPVALDPGYFGLGDFIVNRYKVAVLARDLSPTGTAPSMLPNRRLDASDLVLMNSDSALKMIPLREALGDTLTLVRWRKRW